MHATIRKFGWPATLIHEFEHWLVLLRPAQPALGSLVLAARSEATAFGALEPGAHAELAEATAQIETVLRAFTDYERINYLMLMMVDPHVHFHVIPRYNGERSWQELAFPDAGWPGPPELGAAHRLTEAQTATLVSQLKNLWP